MVTAGRRTFKVCTLGEDEVTRLLPDLVVGETVGERTIEVQAERPDSLAQDCDLAYLAASQATAIRWDVFAQLRGEPTLLVSSVAGFASAGGHIEFTLRGKRIHPIINRSAADASGLRISAQLYRLATVID